MAFVPLENIVQKFLARVDGGDSDFIRAYWLAVDGYRDLNWDVSGYPKSVTLEVSANNTVVLPDDFIDLIDFGFINGQGEIVSLRENNNLSLANSTDCDRVQTSNDGSGVVDTSFFLDTYGYPFVGSYGVGSHVDRGSYRLDRENNLIVLNYTFSEPVSELVVEYMADINCCDGIHVHPYLEEAVIAFITWKWFAHNKTITMGDKQMNWRQYVIQRNKAKSRMKSHSFKQLSIEFRRSCRAAVKI